MCEIPQPKPDHVMAFCVLRMLMLSELRWCAANINKTMIADGKRH